MWGISNSQTATLCSAADINKPTDQAISYFQELGSPHILSYNSYTSSLWNQAAYAHLSIGSRNRLIKLSLTAPEARALLRSCIQQNNCEAALGLLIWMDFKNIAPEPSQLSDVLSLLAYDANQAGIEVQAGIAVFVKYCIIGSHSVKIPEDVKRSLWSLAGINQCQPWLSVILEQPQAERPARWSTLLARVLPDGCNSSQTENILNGLLKCMKLCNASDADYVQLYRDCLVADFPRFYPCLFNEDSGTAIKSNLRQIPAVLKQSHWLLSQYEDGVPLSHKVLVRHAKTGTFEALLNAGLSLHELPSVEGRNPLTIAVEKAINEDLDTKSFAKALEQGLQNGKVTPQHNWDAVCDFLIQVIEKKESHSLLAREITLFKIICGAMGDAGKYQAWLERFTQETHKTLATCIPPGYNSVAVVLMRDSHNSFSDAFYEWCARSPKPVALFSCVHDSHCLFHERGAEKLTGKTTLYIKAHGNCRNIDKYSPEGFAEFLKEGLAGRCEALPDYVVLHSCETAVRPGYKQESAAARFSKRWQEIIGREATVIGYDGLVGGDRFTGLKVMQRRRKRGLCIGNEVMYVATGKSVREKRRKFEPLPGKSTTRGTSARRRPF